MPKLRKNVRKVSLTKEEREEFESVGATEDQINRYEQLLKQESWDFWSKASQLFVTLKASSEMVTRNGKVQVQDQSASAKFNANFYATTDREKARLILLSDAYQEGRIKLVEDKFKEDSERDYAKFRSVVMANPENIERLKKDLAEVEA